MTGFRRWRNGGTWSTWRIALHLALAALLGVTSACSSLPPPAAARPGRSVIDHYGFDGDLIVRQRDRVWRVSLSWQHSPQQDRILLSGPLGQGLAEIVRDAQGAHLTDAKGKTYAAADAETLLQQVIGIPAPINPLPRWLLADIDPTLRDSVGRPKRAVEGGWVIDYTAYESDLADALPHRIELQRDDLSVSLSIDQWQLD